MTAAIGVLALATVLNGGAGGAPPNIREQVGRIRALSASPATLGTAAAAALALQLRYPGNPEIRELLEDVTARRHLCIAALRLLRERLKERRDLRVLDDVTRAHLAHLRAVDATAGGALPALEMPRLRVALLTGPGHDGFYPVETPNDHAAHTWLVTASSAHDCPPVHIAVRLASPRLQLQWSRGGTQMLRLPVHPEMTCAENPAHAALAARETALRAQVLGAPHDLDALIDLASVRHALRTTLPRVIAPRREYVAVPAVRYTLAGRIGADLVFPVPAGGAVPPARAARLPVAVRASTVFDDTGEGPGHGASFGPHQEHMLAEEMRRHLRVQFASKVAALLRSHAREVLRSPRLPAAVRAEWELLHMLSADAHALPQAYLLLLDRPALAAADAWRPALLPPRESPPPQRPDADAAEGYPRCRVDMPCGPAMGFIVAPCVIATSADAADAPAALDVAGPAGRRYRATLWAWDRTRGFALLKVPLDCSIVPWAGPARTLDLSAARDALDTLLPAALRPVAARPPRRRP